MNKHIFPLLMVILFAFTFIGCSGGVLSQKAMDAKIETLTNTGQEKLRPVLESACDEKFDGLVQSLTDSIITAAIVE